MGTCRADKPGVSNEGETGLGKAVGPVQCTWWLIQLAGESEWWLSGALITATDEMS